MSIYQDIKCAGLGQSLISFMTLSPVKRARFKNDAELSSREAKSE